MKSLVFGRDPDGNPTTSEWPEGYTGPIGLDSAGNTELGGAGYKTITDPINPKHYIGAGGVQAIDVIEAFGLGYTLGNVIKYVLRADCKGERKVDLRKALWYLQREIKHGQAETRPPETKV